MYLCLVEGFRKGYIYLPPYTTFYGVIGSLLHGQVYTYTSTRIKTRIRSVKGFCNIQPFPRLFLDEFLLFLDEKGLIFGRFFLYLEYNTMKYEV